MAAFESFSVLDLYAVVVAALAIVLAVLQAAQTSPTLPVGAGVLTVLLGAVAVLLIAYRIVNQPGPNEFIEIREGAWLGLIAAIAITVGGWESIRDESARGVPDGPEPELRPAP
jgi:ABC-type transport system involved in multi-copper enzyme maturation permease subunit